MFERFKLLACTVALYVGTVYADDVQMAKDRQQHAEALDVAAVRALAVKDGWNVFAGNPVIDCGDEGQWDAGALGSMTVLTADDVFHVYYEAWGVRSE